MGTFEDLINEEGERFLEYLDIDTIVESDNPHKEFLRQFEIKFGTKRGLNLLNNVVDKYAQLNKLFKNKIIQDRLTKKTPLRRAETKSFWKKRKKKVERRVIKKEVRIKETKKFFRGKYTPRQINFIKKRIKLNLSELSYEFNKIFKNKPRTKIALRDKRLRLLGKKK